jgi:hypothetical protein
MPICAARNGYRKVLIVDIQTVCGASVHKNAQPCVIHRRSRRPTQIRAKQIGTPASIIDSSHVG